MVLLLFQNVIEMFNDLQVSDEENDESAAGEDGANKEKYFKVNDQVGYFWSLNGKYYLIFFLFC